MRIIGKKLAVLMTALLLCSVLSVACMDVPGVPSFLHDKNTASPEVDPETVTPGPDGLQPGETEPEVTEPEVTEPEAPGTEPAVIPATFLFGGAELPTGITEIDSETRDAAGHTVVGDREHIKHITREEVENLVNFCPNIRKLDLDYCYLDDYTPLAKLTGLTMLGLKTCGNNYGGVKLTDISWITSLTNLKELNLCYNAISDISPISGLKQLEALNLADNDLNDAQIRYLSGLTNLRELDLYYLSRLTDVSPLAELPALDYLNLGHDHALWNVRPLASLNYLTQLRVYDTGVTDISCFSSFKELRYLDLTGCSVNPDSLYLLGYCPKLKAVTFSEASADVRSAFYNLRSIELWEKWDDPTSRVDFEDLWTAIDKSGVCQYLDMNYSQVRAKGGTLQTAGSRHGERDYMLYPFYFEKLSDFTFTFDADYSAMYGDGLDLYEDYYPGYIIEQYFDGSERCTDVLVWNLSTLGFNGKVRASDIGAEITWASNEEGDWCARVYYGPYWVIMHCDANGWIDGSSWCTIRYAY